MPARKTVIKTERKNESGREARDNDRKSEERERE